MVIWSPQLPSDAQARRYRLVAVDLDSILQPDGRVHPSDAAALRAAHAAGVKVVLASALPPQAMHRYWAQLGLGAPVIALNGALVYDFPLHRQVTGQPLPPAQLRLAVETIQQASPKATVGVQHGDSWSTNRLSAASQAMIKRLGDWPVFIGDLAGRLDNAAYQVWVDGATPERQDVETALTQAGFSPAHYTDPARLTLQAASVSREWALATLAGLLEINPDEVLAIGGGGDRASLQLAAFAVVVADMSQEMRAELEREQATEASVASVDAPRLLAVEGSDGETWLTPEP